MSETIRPDMVNNAVSFLTDPSVKDTPLTKKIQFLESKGMTNSEIQQSLVKSQQNSSISSNTNTTSSTVSNNNYRSYPLQQQNPLSTAISSPFSPPLPPPPRNYDWKDYVIMGTTTVGFLFGAYQIISKYVIPNVIPPSQSKLDDDKEAMEREFDRVESILKKLETDQLEFIKVQNEKSNLIDETLIEIDAIVKSTNEKNLRNEETLKYLKLEIDSIKTTLLKNLESQKSTISNELQELEKKTDNITNSLTNLSLNSKDKPDASLTSSSISSPIPHNPNKPPPNLLTNNRSTSSTPTYSNLNIPPPSLIPSAKDLLASSSPPPPSLSSHEIEKPTPNLSDNSTIPAWQLASSQKANINNSNTSIPAWQLAAQDN